MTTPRRKLIEVALPLEAINKASAREKSIRHGHPSTLHLWWARRPLAACRAVLFAQLVDDPSSWPDLFPTERDQDAERQRLFDIIKELVPWEASTDTKVLNRARLEIARSFARGRLADGEGDERDRAVLAEGVKAEKVLTYLAEVVPPVHDPFAGGGSIPLEAQRLGLRAIATDLNPVAVLINKALIEIPPKFAGQEPVGPMLPGDEQAGLQQQWCGAAGLAEDVRRYGAWMREQAWKRIGHLYPEVELPKEEGGGKATVIACLWARTVESPNPAFRGVHVPLASSFWLSKKEGARTWVEPVLAADRRSYQFVIRHGTGGPDPKETVNRKGATCLASGDPIPFSYIRQQAAAGRTGLRLMAVAVEGHRRRIYLPPIATIEKAAMQAEPRWWPQTDLPAKALGFRIQKYGMLRHADLFTPRQLVTLGTFAQLLDEAHAKILEDATAANRPDADEYARALVLLLAMTVSRRIERWTSLNIWNTIGQKIETFIRLNAISMAWDFAEANPFSDSTGSYSGGVDLTAKAVAAVPCGTPALVEQRDACAPFEPTANGAIISTDPPYYDNVPYADLSDVFYTWLREPLRKYSRALGSTLLVPKAGELVADPHRHGGKDEAEQFFLQGMSGAIEQLALASGTSPATLFYAFKQSETTREGTSSTGWETFLAALVDRGFAVVGTWPVRTERGGGLRNVGRNALASSIVLVCRKRDEDAPTITRGRFRRTLRTELPAALRALEKGNIAPVDMAQASIGPGMAIFSRHSRVLEADDSPMTVRAALQLINEVVDEIRGEEEAELDRETRFAVTWFETHGFEAGPYGEAEVLATARAVSVSGVAEAGVCKAAAGKVRLIPRPGLPDDWDPVSDRHLTVWEATQHLIKRLEDKGESAAARLMSQLGPVADDARLLAYRLYTVCERRGWAEEGRAYNGLVVAWPDLERMAGSTPAPAPGAQPQLFEDGRHA